MMKRNKTVERLVSEARRETRRSVVEALQAIKDDGGTVVLDNVTVTDTYFEGEHVLVLGDYTLIEACYFRNRKLDADKVSSV